jgi:hypothetical protein
MNGPPGFAGSDETRLFMPTVFGTPTIID